MLERIRSQPWMVATIVLAVALVVALVALFTGDGEEPDEVEAAVTTTSVAGVEGGPPTTVAESGPGYLAVVVDNAPAAHPQVGLAETPLLIEYPVEGGLTRFNALLPGGSVGLIGPVRSLRPVNALLLPTLTSAVVSTGGQPFVVEELTGTGITSVTPDVGTGFVGLGRPSPHDVFLDLDQLAELFAPDASAPGLPSGSLPASSGAAAEIGLPYTGVSYAYDNDARYARHLEGSPYQVLDSSGSDPVDLAHDTLVVLYAAERPAGYQDSNDVPVSTFDVIGAGDLQVFHEGEVFEGTWSRAAVADPFVFTDSSGGSFGLPEGTVYLAIVPRGSTVSVN